MAIQFPVNKFGKTAIQPTKCKQQSRTVLTPTKHGMVKSVKKVKNG